MNDPQIAQAQNLLAIAQRRLDEARADRPGTAGHGERVRVAEELRDVLAGRLAALREHRAETEARAARQAAVVAVPPPAVAPVVDPAALEQARRDVEAAEAEAARVRDEQRAHPAWHGWADRVQATDDRLRAARLRLAALERQAGAALAGRGTR